MSVFEIQAHAVVVGSSAYTKLMIYYYYYHYCKRILYYMWAIILRRTMRPAFSNYYYYCTIQLQTSRPADSTTIIITIRRRRLYGITPPKRSSPLSPPPHCTTRNVLLSIPIPFTSYPSWAPTSVLHTRILCSDDVDRRSFEISPSTLSSAQCGWRTMTRVARVRYTRVYNTIILYTTRSTCCCDFRHSIPPCKSEKGVCVRKMKRGRSVAINFYRPLYTSDEYTRITIIIIIIYYAVVKNANK